MAGPVGHAWLLFRADDFDLDATIRLQAFDKLLVLAVFGAHLLALVASDRLLFALAFGIDATGFEALADDVFLYRRGALVRQLLVVAVRADAVGMTDGNDDFELEFLGLDGEVVELRLAFSTQHSLVVVEQGIG